jgi:membrane-associated phospholipid phosphatase
MIRLLLVSLILARAVVASPAESEGSADPFFDVPAEEPAGAELERAPSFSDFHRVLFHNFTRGLFSVGNLEPLATGSLGALAVLPFDQGISDAFRGDFHQLGDTGHVIGGPAAMAGLTAGLLAVTPFTENQKYRAFTFTLAQGAILSNVLVYSLKLAIPRDRPNGENDQSFPSGHAANTVVLATIASHYYGKKVGLPIYILAGLVGASRIEKGKHFPSDTVFGATIGYISATTAIRGSERFASERSWSILPSSGPGAMGLQFRWCF